MNDDADVTNDPNVDFDWTRRQWYRYDPETNESTFLDPQPDPPRLVSIAVQILRRIH
jgi:hypothetical protein